MLFQHHQLVEKNIITKFICKNCLRWNVATYLSNKSSLHMKDGGGGLGDANEDRNVCDTQTRALFSYLI